MRKADHDMLITAIWASAAKVGMRPDAIADDIIKPLFPQTIEFARAEGGESIFRTGMIKFVKSIIRAKKDDQGQGTFSDIDPKFEPIVATLKSGAYQVPSIGAYMTIPELVKNVVALDEARKYMRRKALENAKEADALDALYYAVMAANDDASPAKAAA